jgi:nucleoside phosphorylase
VLRVLLVVAATAGELGDVPGLVCGVGPVEAAAATAAAIAAAKPSAVLNVGLAGARTFSEPRFVIGSRALYCDSDDARWIDPSVEADAGLVAAVARVLPDAAVEPIGTSARVGGTHGCEFEAMEGYAVLRAAARAGVPAVEVRVLTNEIAEQDRVKWRFAEGKRLLAAALPMLVEELGRG